MPYLTHRLREQLRDRTTVFTCGCTPGREFRGHRAYNVHHHARHGAYWGGKAGKAAGRKMGKGMDTARRYARARLEEHGLVDRTGRRTDRWRTRPEVSGRVGVRTLRQAARHQRDHDRADWHRDRAAARDATAARHKARAASRGSGATGGWSKWRAGRHETAATRHRAKETGRRDRWAEVPSRAAPAPRPAPAPKARPAPAAKTRPAPARTAPVRTPAPPPSRGRLAPAVPGNGHRPAPARTPGRTRT